MVDNYDNATAGLGGALGNWGGGAAAGSGFNKREGAYDERLQDMRRHLRAQQEKHQRQEQRRKSREREMAQKWTEHQAEVRNARQQEVRERLAREQNRQALVRPPGRKPMDSLSEFSARHREHGASGCLAGSLGGAAGTGANGHSARAEAEANTADTTVDRDSLSVTEEGHAAGSTAPATAAASGQEVAPSKAPSPRARKKKREEVAVRAGGAQREKSIMQLAQEQFQGLCKSSDGRAILDSGTKHQRKHREALVKGDPTAVEMAEQEAEEKGEEEQEQEVQEQPTIPHKHMARRYRLRMMNQITAQVLHCRKKMANNFQETFLSPRGLGCSPLAEADLPPKPMQGKWVTSVS